MEVVNSHKNHSKNLNENAQIKDQQTTSSCSEKTERKREKVLDMKHIHLHVQWHDSLYFFKLEFKVLVFWHRGFHPVTNKVSY